MRRSLHEGASRVYETGRLLLILKATQRYARAHCNRDGNSLQAHYQNHDWHLASSREE